MGNTSLTTDLITREALRVAHEKLSFLGTINREYDSSFAGAGGNHGSTLRVRKPVQYTRRTGSRVMDIQDSLETSSTITVATQDGVDMRFNSAELTLDIEDFSQRYIVPAVSQLVAGIEGDMISQFTKDIYNVVGTAGTPPADLAALGAARARLNQQLAPKDGQRFVQMDSVTMGGMVNGLKGLFQDSAQIKEAMREGFYGRLAMADLYENEKVWTMPNSGDVAGTLDTYTVVEGDTDLTVTGFSAAPVAGMVFTIAGVYDCHPETKAAYSHLKQFVVTSATTTVINFSPAIRISGARKNVSTATGADISPSTTAAITFVGNASTNYQQSLMYHKDAFTFVTADLPIMDDAAKCVRRTQDGLSLRVWQGSDIRNDEMLTRIDILYGGLTLRPEWAVRITS